MPETDSKPTNSLGLKGFNQTGRNDTTTEVLRTKTNPAVARRNMALIAIAVVALCISFYVVFRRSGLDLRSIMAPEGNSFGHGHSEQNFDKKDE